MNSQFSSPSPFPIYSQLFCLSAMKEEKKRQNIISFSMSPQSALATVIEPPTLPVDNILMKKKIFNKTGFDYLQQP